MVGDSEDLLILPSMNVEGPAALDRKEQQAQVKQM